MNDTTKLDAQAQAPGMTYRGADGRAHILPAQEQAAHEAQRNRDAPKPDLPGLAVRTPD